MILFIVFVVQFSVSCACLALSKEQQVCLLFICKNLGWPSRPAACAHAFQINAAFTLNINTSRPCDFHWQDHLLEVGWNKSEATQKDVEKTLNCCGFSYVDNNGSCAAVSNWSEIFLSFSSQWRLVLDFLITIMSLAVAEFSRLLPRPLEMLSEQPSVDLRNVLEHYPAVCGRSSTVCWQYWTLLQFYRGQ